MAGRAIAQKVEPRKKSINNGEELTELLQRKCGAFVSVYVDQKLRGCIGTFSEDEAMYKNVIKMAVSAATTDTRFAPLLPEELSRLVIEISVLSPRQRIFDPSDIEIGKHGIYIQQGSNRGTLLPQVAVKEQWSIKEFLGNCSRYKAGIGWDGWKMAELFTYEALVFKSEALP